MQLLEVRAFAPVCAGPEGSRTVAAGQGRANQGAATTREQSPAPGACVPDLYLHVRLPCRQARLQGLQL